jgi:hypothetical protein
MREAVIDLSDVEAARSLVPPSGGPNECVTALQRLAVFLDEVEEFVVEQCRRLEMTIESLEASSGEDVSGQEAQVTKWRRLWDDEHAAERRRLQEEGQLLRHAWKEMEDEQRRLLALRESFNAGHGVPAEAVNNEPLAADVPEVGEMALSQFQELRRQMQSHARRGRPA